MSTSTSSPGEVVALLGHNGAGKSTLIKVLSGVYPADDGEIRVGGQPVRIEITRDAKALGIETIYQNLALAENLDAVANLFLGRERYTRFGFLDEETMEHETRRMLDRMKLRLPSLRNEVSRLSGGQRQAIAIGRAVYFDAKILIMDEPTAALGPEETAKVGELVRELKSQGIGIFLISHDIHDVFDLADRMTVLSHGRVVGTVRTSDVTKDDVLVDDHSRPDAGPLTRRAVKPASRRGAERMIDAHVHLWRLARGDNLALLPSMAPIYRDREPDHLRPLLDAAGIDRIIVVQAAWTLAETLFTIGLAQRASLDRRRRRLGRPAVAFARRGDRGTVRDRPAEGHPSGQHRRQPLDRMDARRAFRALLVADARARAGARLPPPEPGRGAARHALRAPPSRDRDRPRPLRQARHRRRTLPSPGRRHRDAGGVRRTCPASSRAFSTAPRRAPARTSSGPTRPMSSIASAATG